MLKMEQRMENINKQRVVLIMQARMGAARLPGKPLKTVMGKPLLAYQLERLQRATTIDQIVVATTTNPQDHQIVDFCRVFPVACFRGSEHDVLDRYYQAAKHFDADVVVRVTADCPLIDPVVLDQVIGLYFNHIPPYDYVSNSLERTYPRGLDAEVFSFKALEKAAKEAIDPEEREHVTPYFYRHPEKFSLGCLKNDIDESHHRWTVDTAEDLELVTRIFEALYSENTQFQMKDVLQLLKQHPEWVAINAHILQKQLRQPFEAEKK